MSSHPQDYFGKMSIVKGRGFTNDSIAIVVKLSPTGKLVIITVYRD
ncbi:MAG: hypothetical protein V1872_05010 [bacterium]